MINRTNIQAKWLNQWRTELKEKRLKPIFVQWLSTKNCNFNCKYCGTNAGKIEEDELTTPEMLKLIDDLAILGCRRLSVTGGEPLLREDIFEILRYARYKGIRASIVSNGYFTEEYFIKLKKIDLYVVSISIDGYRKKHDQIRRMNGSYERCLKSLDIYSRLKVPVVRVVTVVLEDNIKDIPKIINDIFRHGCTQLRLQLIMPEGRAKSRENSSNVVKKALRIIYNARKRGTNIFAADNFGYLGSLEKEVRSHNFLCGCGWWTFTVMQNGDIMGCPVTDYPELNEGNIRHTDIKEIWWDKFQRFRKTMLEDLPLICKRCKYIEVCRGGCWADRMSRGRFCYLDVAEELREEFI